MANVNGSLPGARTTTASLAKMIDTKPRDPVESGLLPGQRTLDETTQGLINDKLARSGYMSDEHRQQELMQGVKFAGDPVLHGFGSEETNQLGMPTPKSVGEALEKRTNRDFGSKLRELQRNVEFQDVGRRADELVGTGQALAKYEQVKIKIHEQKMQNYKQLQALKSQKDQERGQFLGSIFGLAGTAVGLATGGPGGAALGGAVGGIVGQGLA